jgi:hypothetical protein
MAKARKMVGLNIEETSGVDHPAHLHEGWLVIKSEHSGVDDLLSDLESQNEQAQTVVLAEGTKETVMPQDELVEIVDKAGHDKKEEETMSYADAMKKIKMLEDELEMSKKKMDKMMHDMDEMGKKPAAKSVEEETTDLVKEAPEALRKMIEDFEKSASDAKARAEVAETVLKAERDARANEVSVAKAKEWTHLAIDAEKVGPALASLAAVDADLAKALEDVLVSVNAQAESANIFAEIGKSASPTFGDAYSQLTSMAKAAVDITSGISFEQAFASAVNSNPDLYNQYLNEKGAK